MTLLTHDITQVGYNESQSIIVFHFCPFKRVIEMINNTLCIVHNSLYLLGCKRDGNSYGMLRLVGNTTVLSLDHLRIRYQSMARMSVVSNKMTYCRRQRLCRRENQSSSCYSYSNNNIPLLYAKILSPKCTSQLILKL